MYRTLVGATMTAAPVAMAVAAIAAGISAREPSWWAAAVHLAILGGIMLMIYAVNTRLVPVFSRRQWTHPRLVVAQILLGGAGAWLAFAGYGLRLDGLVRGGHLLAFGGGLLFMMNIVRLFKQPTAIPLAAPERATQQQAVDAVATRFMRFSGTLLVLGLALGALLSWWRPESGRWDLVWAHALLVGFFMTMAAGVCYHVLSRWSGRPWRSVAAIRLHLRLVTLSVPLMLLALALDVDWLFLIAGPLQAAAIALFLVNVAPLVWRLDGTFRPAVVAAGLFLVFGVGLGVSFAIDPALGPRLRQAHAMANLFGWGGLLISGFGYRFVPSFAGRGLRWPALAKVEVATVLLGALGGVAAVIWRMYGDGPDSAALAPQLVVGAGLLLFAAQTAGTFAGRPPAPVITIRPRRSAPVPGANGASTPGLTGHKLYT